MSEQIWTLAFDKKALKKAKSIDKNVMKRIKHFLETRIVTLENPREIGKALVGDLSEYWRYRVGDYRIICKIEDEIITILVIEIGHRREIYR